MASSTFLATASKRSKGDTASVVDTNPGTGGAPMGPLCWNSSLKWLVLGPRYDMLLTQKTVPKSTYETKPYLSLETVRKRQQTDS